MYASEEGICYFDQPISSIFSPIHIVSKEIEKSPAKVKKSFFSKVFSVFRSKKSKEKKFKEKKPGKPLSPRPESPPILENIEFSLCGATIILADEKERELIFDSHKISADEGEIHRISQDKNLVIRVRGQYYDVESVKFLMPELLNENPENIEETSLIIDNENIDEILPVLVFFLSK